MCESNASSERSHEMVKVVNANTWAGSYANGDIMRVQRRQWNGVIATPVDGIWKGRWFFLLAGEFEVIE